MITSQKYNHPFISLDCLKQFYKYRSKCVTTQALETIFQVSHQILHWETHPECQGMNEQQILTEKLTHYINRLRSLVDHIDLCELEIGWLCVQGEELRLYEKAHHTSMMDWIKYGLGIQDLSLISRSIQKYKSYLYVRDFGISLTDILEATPIQIKAIELARREMSVQRSQLQKQFFQEERDAALARGEVYPEKIRGLSKEQMYQLDMRVNTVSAKAAQEKIQEILLTNQTDLLADLAATGGVVVKPTILLKTEESGVFLYFTGSLAISHAYLDAMSKNKCSFVFSFHGKQLSLEELAEALRETFE
jgi:hypothetical protein